MNTQASILIVDDDDEIRDLLCNYLQDFGFETTGVGNAIAMRAAMATQEFDLLILDLMLPGEDGLSLCRHLRATSDIPIIMVTARGEATDRIVGLELGADDYIIKPFDTRELVARMHSVLRRTHAAVRKESSADTGNEDSIIFDGWILNRTMRQLTSPQHMVVPLSNAEFRLLWAFVERPRRVLSRDQLLDAARGGMNAFDRSIDLLVSRLRQKMKEDPKRPKLLKTIRGEGYMFDAVVER